MRINLFSILGFSFMALGTFGVTYAVNISEPAYGVAWFIVCWAAGSVFIGLSMRSEAKKAREDDTRDEQMAIAMLKSRGRKIMTEFKTMVRRRDFQFNDQSPVVVYARDAQGRTYESQDIWFKGEDMARRDDPAFKAWQRLQAIDPAKKYLIPVYVDPNDPKHYYMDLAGLEVR